MGYKGLCQIKSLASRVAFSGSVHESFSFSCFAQRTVLYGIQGFVSIKKYCFWGGFTRAAPENLSLFTKSQGRFNRFLSFSCFAQRTVLYGV
jgi:hypothetical protein